ncbi:MAG: type IV toxin-antitoxin system AbiEi family antitoxin domain-containing protein [Elusimicrobia bacterium]|nr:type IV toxin-antitoxin system AbiEi family antitoxin domain-containing protein [Elusimicrobiota bacterium]
MATHHLHRESSQRLFFDFAEGQDGYFTAKQAESAGFDKKNHHYHVRSGSWIRECRGVYRLATFPIVRYPDMITWSLWSRDRTDKPQGIYSHETALSVHDLSDLNPPKLHMTVPPDFRRNAPTPGVLVLHRGTLHEDDIERRPGFRLTRPLKAIADLIAANDIEETFLRQAAREARQRGLIIRSEVAAATRIPDDVKKKIIEFMGEI